MPEEYCDFYELGDICDECIKRRHRTFILHDDAYYDSICEYDLYDDEYYDEYIIIKRRS